MCVAALALAAASEAAATGYSPHSFFSQNWTHDGTALVYQAHAPEHGIQRVTLDGHVSTLLQGLGPPARVSALGELAYVATGDARSPRGALTVRSAAGVSRVVAHAFQYGGLAWSPDGGAIAFQAASGRLAVIRADGSGLRELSSRGNDPAWSPDGTRVVFSRGSETAVVDVTSGATHAVGPTTIGAQGVHTVYAYPSAVWSPDSNRLAIQLGDGVHIVRSDGSGQQALIRGAYHPSWSPDGSELALLRDDDIVAAAADGSSERTVIASAMTEMTPTWSPDGRWIAYTNRNTTPPGQAYQRGHAADVFVIRPDGTGRRSLTGGCGVRPDTPLTWLCVVNGSWSVPLADAPSPTVRITTRRHPRAIVVPVHLTDGKSYVYGARVTVSQIAGPRVRVTSMTRKAPSLLSDTGGRAAFRFLKPRGHGTVSLRVVAAGQARVVKIRV